MKLILSYDEAQKIGRHILNMSPYIFEDLRIEDDGKKDSLHICFEKYKLEDEDES